MTSTFSEWVSNREVRSLGTNHGAIPVPFQRWQKFKEAFAPELIREAIESSSIGVQTLLDPFGGSGTSALAAQFLGVRPATIEVNPYLADLIEAKLTRYDVIALSRDMDDMMAQMSGFLGSPSYGATVEALLDRLPHTFVESEAAERWIFSKELAGFLLTVIEAISKLETPQHRRLLRVLVGGRLVELSNTRVNGKGRRYRSGWSARQRTPEQAAVVLTEAFQDALSDITQYNHRREQDFTILRGDARDSIKTVNGADISIFSPPYPNSFDYTDVYNIELWMLQYLTSREDNALLRHSTLSSHVQLRRDFPPPPEGSDLLDSTLQSLQRRRNALWNRHIPEMVGAYFADMDGVVEQVSAVLNPGGQIWMVVGDSRYSDVNIPVASILEGLAKRRGLSVVRNEPFRSMRSSPQQGGRPELPESLLVLQT